MRARIVQVRPTAIERYAAIPIRFTIRSVLRVEVRDGGFGGLVLHEEPVEPPYVKDYDAIEGVGPDRWAASWDLSKWGIFMAVEDGADVGAVAVAFDAPEMLALEGRKDMAALWDIRVHPDHRGRGVGAVLFRSVADWAREHGCTQMHVETQNNNVAACRFYAAMGCQLGSIHRFAYRDWPEVAEEAMLLWYLDL